MIVITGKYKELGRGRKESTILFKCFCKDMPGYSSSNAPAISLEGPRRGWEQSTTKQPNSKVIIIMEVLMVMREKLHIFH